MCQPAISIVSVVADKGDKTIRLCIVLGIRSFELFQC